jgi:hypothetical protein
MANVNDNGGTHASFNESASYSSTNRDAAGNGAVLFWPYDGGKPRETLKQAMAIIQHSVVGKVGPATQCGKFFAGLPNHQTFDQVWSSLWINWHPYSGCGFLGATSRGEITLSNDCFDKGVWVAVATIMHEMAHVNGAPAGTSAAEDTLKNCGMWKHWSAGSVGLSVRDSGDSYA